MPGVVLGLNGKENGNYYLGLGFKGLGFRFEVFGF